VITPGALRVVGSKVKWTNANNDTVRKVVDPGTFPPNCWKGMGGGASFIELWSRMSETP